MRLNNVWHFINDAVFFAKLIWITKNLVTFIYLPTPSFREDWVKIGKSSHPVDMRSKEESKKHPFFFCTNLVQNSRWLQFVPLLVRVVELWFGFPYLFKSWVTSTIIFVRSRKWYLPPINNNNVQKTPINGIFLSIPLSFLKLFVSLQRLYPRLWADGWWTATLYA